MKSNIITALAAVILLMCSAAAVNAQESANQNQQTPARHHLRVNNNNETAAGCLQQNGNGYTLQAQDGTTWQLTSDAMNLGAYVGKEVSVAGTETAANGDHVNRVSSSQAGNNHGPMDVLDLAVVNESCQR